MKESFSNAPLVNNDVRPCRETENDFINASEN